MARRVALPIMALLLLVASPADLAAASPEDTCRFAKFRAGGKYVGCLLKADSNFAKTSRGPADDLARTARIETCLAGFQKSFADVYDVHAVDVVVSRQGSADRLSSSLDAGVAERIAVTGDPQLESGHRNGQGTTAIWR